MDYVMLAFLPFVSIYYYDCADSVMVSSSYILSWHIFYILCSFDSVKFLFSLSENVTNYWLYVLLVDFRCSV